MELPSEDEEQADREYRDWQVSEALAAEQLLAAYDTDGFASLHDLHFRDRQAYRPRSLPERLWGPVQMAEALQCGSPAPATSVLLRPDIDPALLAAVRALVPPEAMPVPEETSCALAERLGRCEWLDDIHVLVHGSGPRRVRLNTLKYSQARRVTWSITVAAPFTDARGQLVQVCVSPATHPLRPVLFL